MYGSFSRSVWPGGGPSHSFNCPLSQQMQQPNVQLLQKSLAYYDNCSKKLWTSISVNTSQSQLLLNSEFRQASLLPPLVPMGIVVEWVRVKAANLSY